MSDKISNIVQQILDTQSQNKKDLIRHRSFQNSDFSGEGSSRTQQNENLRKSSRSTKGTFARHDEYISSETLNFRYMPNNYKKSRTEMLPMEQFEADDPSASMELSYFQQAFMSNLRAQKQSNDAVPKEEFDDDNEVDRESENEEKPQKEIKEAGENFKMIYRRNAGKKRRKGILRSVNKMKLINYIYRPSLDDLSEDELRKLLNAMKFQTKGFQPPPPPITVIIDGNQVETFGDEVEMRDYSIFLKLEEAQKLLQTKYPKEEKKVFKPRVVHENKPSTSAAGQHAEISTLNNHRSQINTINSPKARYASPRKSEDLEFEETYGGFDSSAYQDTQKTMLVSRRTRQPKEATFKVRGNWDVNKIKFDEMLREFRKPTMKDKFDGGIPICFLMAAEKIKASEENRALDPHRFEEYTIDDIISFAEDTLDLMEILDSQAKPKRRVEKPVLVPLNKKTILSKLPINIVAPHASTIRPSKPLARTTEMKTIALPNQKFITRKILTGTSESSQHKTFELKNEDWQKLNNSNSSPTIQCRSITLPEEPASSFSPQVFQIKTVKPNEEKKPCFVSSNKNGATASSIVVVSSKAGSTLLSTVAQTSTSPKTTSSFRSLDTMMSSESKSQPNTQSAPSSHRQINVQGVKVNSNQVFLNLKSSRSASASLNPVFSKPILKTYSKDTSTSQSLLVPKPSTSVQLNLEGGKSTVINKNSILGDGVKRTAFASSIGQGKYIVMNKKPKMDAPIKQQVLVVTNTSTSQPQIVFKKPVTNFKLNNVPSTIVKIQSNPTVSVSSNNQSATFFYPTATIPVLMNANSLLVPPQVKPIVSPLTSKPKLTFPFGRPVHSVNGSLLPNRSRANATLSTTSKNSVWTGSPNSAVKVFPRKVPRPKD